MMDVNYYKKYDKYKIQVDPGDVDRFVEALLFYLDTGLTDLEARVHGDVRGFRAGFVCEGKGYNVYRVLTVEPNQEGKAEDYVMIEMIPQMDTLHTSNPTYTLRILPNSYFTHRVDDKTITRIMKENKLYTFRPAPYQQAGNPAYQGIAGLA